MEFLKNKITLSFNSVTKSLIREIKNKNEDIKICLKQNYVGFDKTSDAYISFFSKHVHDDLIHVLTSDEDVLNNPLIKNTYILKDISVDDLLEKAVTSDKDQNTLTYYIKIMYIFNYLYVRCNTDENFGHNTTTTHKEADHNDEFVVAHERADSEEEDTEKVSNLNETYNSKFVGIQMLFKKTIKLINVLNDEDSTNEFDIEDFTEDVFDEDIKTIFKNLYMDRIEFRNLFQGDFEDQDNQFGIDMNFLNNSKIGSLAKEISDEIDVKSMNVDNPNDLFNMDNMFSNNGNPLGNIIQKVSSTITNKINNGELNQEELMSEAFSLMNKMNGKSGTDNFMQNMMQNMMQGNNMDNLNNLFNDQQNTQATAKPSTTKERLKKKIENKRLTNKKS